MSCFKIPDELCEDIEQLMCNLWWGDEEGKRKVHWMSWKKMCRAKDRGGMGFRNLELFNLSLLSRHGWRLVQEPDSLLATFLRAKYYPHSDFLQAKIGHNPSYTWRSLLHGQAVLREGLVCSIEYGSGVSVWNDCWILRPTSFRVICNVNNGDLALRVSDLINWNSGRWDAEIVRDLLLPCDADLVFQLRLVDPLVQDERYWFYSKDGNYSVRPGYYMLLEKRLRTEGGIRQADEGEINKAWKGLWKLKMIPKTKEFVRRASREILPCKTNLFRRKITDDECCKFCGLGETGFHVLF